MRYLLIVLLFLSVASANAALETEPNNTPEDADVISLNEVMTGALSNYEDLDFFALTIEEPVDLSLRIDKLKNDISNISYAMVDGEGNAFAGGEIFGDRYSSKIVGIEKAGLYYIVIGGAGATNTSTGDYEISLQAFTPSGEEETEPNDELATADNLFENCCMYGHLSNNEDVDLFKFEVDDHISTLTNYAVVELSKLIDDSRYLNYVVFDENAPLASGTVYGGNTNGVLVGIPRDGAYYVAVAGGTEQNTSLNEYQVAVSRGYAINFDVELEPNQSRSQSNYLTTSRGMYGQLYSEEDSDVYRLNIAPNSELDLSVSKVADGFRFIDFELRNEAGDLISAGEVVDDRTEEKRIGIGDGGDYFLTIFSNNGVNTSIGTYLINADYADLSDDDGDGVPAYMDNCIFANADQADTDNDGIGNVCDSDDDNDGVVDSEDTFPLDSNESVDTDGDGIGNNADTDDDGDGYSDSDESLVGTDPLDANSYPETLEEETGGLPIWLYYIVTQPEASSKSAP